ncbi:DUF6266 family protein [Pedobacter frigoris]|uniref:DUF6266 family protein n=1 Tax=Pedobacter frigoris TaxID=2571272 RepID=UPI00292D7C59|nr:DUF6266 family protein [Pedobacter frigoris]
MGKYKKGVLGNFRGKVGTVVGSSWNGLFYMKSLPDFGDYVPTTAQLNVRLRMSLVTKFLADIKSLVSIGWLSKEKRGLTAMNAATSYHLKNAITGVAPAYLMDYPDVKFSEGELEGAEDPEVASAAGHEVEFSWAPNTGMEYGLATDKAVLLVYCPDMDKFVSYRQVARSAGEYVMTLPASFVGSQAHCWIAFFSADGKLASDSSYVGMVSVVA